MESQRNQRLFRPSNSWKNRFTKIHATNPLSVKISRTDCIFQRSLLWQSFKRTCRHPENVIQNIRPIEVIRVDGVYANQTNREEAERVVDLLAEKWSSPERPSIGVVTFNAKQADLIEDVLAERADNDPAFRQALLKKENVSKEAKT